MKNRQDERLFKVLVPKYEIIKSIEQAEYIMTEEEIKSMRG